LSTMPQVGSVLGIRYPDTFFEGLQVGTWSEWSQPGRYLEFWARIWVICIVIRYLHTNPLNYATIPTFVGHVTPQTWSYSRFSFVSTKYKTLKLFLTVLESLNVIIVNDTLILQADNLPQRLVTHSVPLFSNNVASSTKNTFGWRRHCRNCKVISYNL
jgi:hypothetical protein